MLERLFGSRLRTQLLELFLANPDRPFGIEDLAPLVRARTRNISRELKELVSLGVLHEDRHAVLRRKRGSLRVRTSRSRTRIHYSVNSNFRLYPELKAITVKSALLFERPFSRYLLRIGNVRYLAFTGSLTDTQDVQTDILIIGRANRAALARLVRRLSRELARPLHYTLFSPAEYRYRLAVGDRFLYGILENKKIVVIDRLS